MRHCLFTRILVVTPCVSTVKRYYITATRTANTGTYLTAHVRRQGISRDATSLKNLDPYVGDLMLDEIHDGRSMPALCLGMVMGAAGARTRHAYDPANGIRVTRRRSGQVREGSSRVVILNDVAQSIVHSRRGLHPRYVFTFQAFRGERDRLLTLRNWGGLLRDAGPLAVDPQRA
jgi:hypothetical protein